MKELTDDQIDDIFEGLEHFAPIYMARAAITADRALNAPADRDVARQIPEGWKLVPVEPTDEMIWSAEKAQTRHVIEDQKRGGDPELSFNGIWKAMLAAAPTPPAEQQGEQQPVAYRYRFRSPTGEHVWRYSHESWNGQNPSEAEALYTQPSPSLAELRAKVEALPNMTAYDRWCRKDAVLALLDQRFPEEGKL